MPSRLRSAAAASAVALFGWLALAGCPHAARAGDAVGRSMVDYAFARAAEQFYKPTADQTLLDGAVTGLRVAIAAHHGDPRHLPALKARGGVEADTAALNAELALATAKFGRAVGARQLSYAAIRGMMASLHDRWTVFMDPAEFRGLNEALDGASFAGVGILIDVNRTTQTPEVVQTVDDGPAQRAGVLAGDVILKVDGKETKGLTTTEDSGMLRGKAGTTVELTVGRKGQTDPLVFRVVRATIHEPSVIGTVVKNDIGYLRVFVFGQTTGQEVARAVARLSTAGVKGFVLDLRGNGGGYLSAAIDVSSEFVPQGPIVSVDSRTQPLTTFDADGISVAALPLAVLVNGSTASASEITSGAIQDSGSGVLVGTRTFGKGVVQTIYKLPDGSAVKITTARYLTPNGRDINQVGIAPDIVVPDVDASTLGDPTADAQLQRAIAYVESKI